MHSLPIFENRSRQPFIFILFFFLSVTAFAQKDDDSVITVDSSIVVMNASITDASGKAVTGLTQKYFHILEDGVEQKIDTFEAEETPFAAVVLLDTSGSMENRVTLARSAAIQFLNGMRATDVTAVYNFDSKINLLQDFSNSSDFLSEKIFDLKASGMTVLNDAIYRAVEVLSKRPEKRRAIVVLSDGADTFSKTSTDKALKLALAINATIYTVDMSAADLSASAKLQNKKALETFADKTGGQYIATPGGIALRDAFKRIAEELGVQYTLAYSPSNTKADGKWRSLELKVAKPGLTIRTRQGYNAPKEKK